MSGKRNDIWIPFYVADYLADTGRLTTTGHGAYLLLLMDYWNSGGPLPDDDEQLAAVTKLPMKDWLKLRPVLGKKPFFDVADGVWRQKRADEEIAKRAGISRTRSEVGKAGAEKRHGKKIDGKMNIVDLANAKQARQQNDAHSESESQEEESDANASSPPPPRGDDVAQAVGLYNQVAAKVGLISCAKVTAARRVSIGKRLKESGLEGWITALDALEHSPFCRGENDRSWRADIDFVCQPKSFTKLIEGSYQRDDGGRPRSDLFAGGSPPRSAEPFDEEAFRWRNRCQMHFVRGMAWDTGWGPAPGQRWCEVPAKILAEFADRQAVAL